MNGQFRYLSVVKQINMVHIASRIHPRVITRPHYWPVRIMEVQPDAKIQRVKFTPEVEWMQYAKKQFPSSRPKRKYKVKGK